MIKAGSLGLPGWMKGVIRTTGFPFCNKQVKVIPQGVRNRGSAVRSALNPFHMDRLQPLVGAQSEVWVDE